MQKFALKNFNESAFGFWCQWVITTVLGFLISLYWVEVGFRSEVGALEGAIGGGMVGMAQWLVLRRRIPLAWEWGAASAIGWALVGLCFGALGWVAPRGMYDLSLRFLYGTLEGVRVGVLIGIVQWFALRPKVPHAWCWIPGNVVSWAIGLGFAWTTGAMLRVRLGLFLGEVMGLVLGWTAIGAMTGLILMGLLQAARKPGFRAVRGRLRERGSEVG